MYYDPSGYAKKLGCPPGAKNNGDGVSNSYPEQQLLNGEEWYKYLRDTYGEENVQGSAYNLSRSELQNATDKVYMAGVNDLLGKSKDGTLFNGGPRQTVTVTQDGKVIISQNSSTVNAQSQDMARQIFGDNVEFVNSGINSVRPNMEGNFGNHSETKGINFLEKDCSSTEGAKQFSSHFSCDSCRDTQRETGILNMTGYAGDNNDKQKRIKY